VNADRPTVWSAQDVATATGGELLSGSPAQAFAGISIDSRDMAADELFVAIVGDVHDGHRFCEAVIEQGGRGLVVAHEKTRELPVAEWERKQICCIAVHDTARALGDLSVFHLDRSGSRVIGITGSNGKTTTRKFTAAVAGQRYKTLATRGNLNNAIGLPLTLLRLTPEVEWAVLEMGTNHPGEIAYLARLCRPEIGVITNIAPAHLEGLGSLDGVMRAKGELLQELKTGGKAVLNADDPHLQTLAAECAHPVVLFGTGTGAAVRAVDIQELADGVRFKLVIAGRQIDIHIRIPGRFMVTNALAAAAVGHLLGLPIEVIKDGLEQVTAEGGRMAVIRTSKDITIVDDAYNANPASMQAAFDALGSLRGGRRGALVLGDMLELGRDAAGWHRKIGAAAARSGADRIYFFGEYAGQAAESARSERAPTADVRTGTQSEIVSDLKSWLEPGDWVLVKGSRGMRMDKIVAALEEWAGGPV
jgi:UDP-N-acetylmuramoyl-tripeptide--D-alanyl-D-alanine ligase